LRNDDPSPGYDAIRGSGEMANLIRTVDWAATPLGPVGSWSETLRTVLGLCLDSRFPLLLWWGPSLTLLYNDAYRPILGDKHPASLGCPGDEVWPEIWEVIGPMVTGVMERGEVTWSHDQLLLPSRRGYPEETYFTFSYSPVREPDGTIAGVFTVVTETTGEVIQKRRMQTLRRLHERTDGARSAAHAFDVAATVLDAAREDVPFTAFYRIDDGATQAELVTARGVETGGPGAPRTLRLDGADGAGDPWPLARAIASRKPVVAPVPADVATGLSTEPWGAPARSAILLPLHDATRDVPTRVIVAGISPWRELDASYESFFSVVCDQVTGAVADAQAREREHVRIEALAELNRAKTQFFSNISHEFRTPLTLMLGPLDEAGDDGLDAAAAAQVRRSAIRLTKLVNTLLDFSRLEEGRLQPDVRPVDLARLTADVAGAFQSAAEAAGLEFGVDCPPLPESVHVDPQLWDRIVLNLLSNALKFTEAGRIEVRLRQDGDEVVLTVADTGVGIPTVDQPALFDRFYRVRSVAGRSYEGSGIGLALVHELTQLHGGSVAVDSELGRGSTFTVRIPLGTDHLATTTRLVGPSPVVASRMDPEVYVTEALGWVDAPTASTADHHLAPAASAADESGADDRPAVLVVDDNADMRDYLVRVLSPYWAVRAVPDGRTALRVLDDARPDLVLTDVMMPRMDGFELLNAIRANPQTQDLPVVVLSARASEHATLMGFEGGADDYVTKPFTVPELVARIRANLELSRLRRRLAAERARSDLVAGLSHDMQTPLAVILGTLTELREEGLTGEERAELTAAAQRRAEDLRLLLQQFLDAARLHADRPLTLDPRPVELAPLVADTVAQLRRGDRTRIESHADLPHVVADPGRVRQILLNLLQNADRHAGGAAVAVTLVAQDGHVVVTVADEGPGIHPDDLDHVFDRFYRGRDAHGTGSGLGLHISRTLAEAQGGRLEVASGGGRGTCFTLTLPTVEAANG
jgi:signal transduction histidine kinase